MDKISKLANVRRKRGLTQAELAALTGVTRVTIARIETGRLNPTVATMLKLASALRVSVDELIDKKAG